MRLVPLRIVDEPLDWKRLRQRPAVVELNSFTVLVEPRAEALLASVDAGSIARDFPVRGAVDPELPLLRGPAPDREPRLKAFGIDVEALGARPNVVLVIVESLRASETGISAARGTTPHLDRLAAEGISIDRFFAAGYRSIKGSFALECGYPPLGADEDYITGGENLHIACLPEILGEAGYTTRWFNNGDRDALAEGPFLKAHGMQQILDGPALHSADRLGFGVSDRRLYAATLEELSRTRGPFFTVVTTGSSHLPYAIPADLAGPQPFSGEYGEYRRALSYASLGAFIEAARREPWFSSTVFIITGDHGAVVAPGEADQPKRGALSPEWFREMFFRVPLVIYGAPVKPLALAGPASQIDVLPTVLDLTGVNGQAASAGQSIFEPAVDRRLYATGLGGTRAVEGDLRCWSDETCVRLSGRFWDGMQAALAQAPALVAWGQRAPAVLRYLALQDRLVAHRRPGPAKTN